MIGTGMQGFDFLVPGVKARVGRFIRKDLIGMVLRGVDFLVPGVEARIGRFVGERLIGISSQGFDFLVPGVEGGVGSLVKSHMLFQTHSIAAKRKNFAYGSSERRHWWSLRLYSVLFS